MYSKRKQIKTLIENWRPITLLNTVYKILSGSLANIIKPYVQTLINKDQTGFISGRFIGENTRLIYDIMKITEVQDIPGMIMLCDFVKKLSILCLGLLYKKPLRFFNFGPIFCEYINPLYLGAFTNVKVNGYLSDTIMIQRGCRQGDPLSPYIFILYA